MCKRQCQKISITDKDLPHIRQNLLHLAQSYPEFYLLDSSGYTNDPYTAYELIVGVGIIDNQIYSGTNLDELYHFQQKQGDWLFGYLSYELKNYLEKLQSKNTDYLGFDVIHFVIPKYVIYLNKSILTIEYHQKNSDSAQKILNELCKSADTKNFRAKADIELKPRMSKAAYLLAVEKLQNYIYNGLIYEANYCQEFYAQNVTINPSNLYQTLQENNPTPFSAFVKQDYKFLLSASPERYLRKTGNRLISQPIKGTAPRHPEAKHDATAINNLKNSIKERAENVMIVDLVRNDLSRVAKKNSVGVDELCRIYSFPKVHQMISTVSCQLSAQKKWTDALAATFPMGSMTGAPKISAMILIDQLETAGRGLYSGALGYVAPNQDFDFNVVIRSLQYNAQKKYLSLMVGGAITALSLPENEYQECFDKVNVILQLLKSKEHVQ